MTDRALLVLDQVSRSALDAELTTRGLPLSTAVQLDYIPRTTPVGHATISTGRPPAVHRVQGRTWYEHGTPPTAVSIGHAVTLTRPTPLSTFAAFDTDSVAARLRAASLAESIVAVAAKDFIPFLFGAWDCDVVVYPFDVSPAPLRMPLAGVGLPIVFIAWTPAGVNALISAWPAIVTELQLMAPAGTTVIASTPISVFTPMVHTATWLLPGSWGHAKLSWKARWSSYVLSHAEDIDDGYTRIALHLANYLPKPRAHLQSCFSSDAHGHVSGHGTPQHATAVARGIDRALALTNAGYAVGVTSDHGGRLTPAVAQYVSAAGTVDGHAVPPGATVHYKDGDHVVGYATGPAPATTQFHFRDITSPIGFSRFHVPPHIATRSYHPQQQPTWKVTGDVVTRVVDKPTSGGGGDHGICAITGAGLPTLSPIDNEVPAWSPNARAHHVPGTLDDIAKWFLGLT